MNSARLLLLALVVAAGSAATAPDVGVVGNVLVLSDKVADVSSIEAWQRAFIKDGMTDAQKALAIWTTVAMHQHQNEPPSELVDNQGPVADTIKLMNVYGYSFCGVATTEIATLARAVGLRARACCINGHVVAELFHDGAWHMYDASLINLFPKSDGQFASVTELCNEVSLWRKAHPELADEAKLRAFMEADGGTRWRTQGPDILSRCPTIGLMGQPGFYPGNSHSWASTMQEYDIDPATDQGEGKGFAARFRDQPYVTGYRVDIALRRGERLIRNWANDGHHVNQRSGATPPNCIAGKTGERVVSLGDYCDLRYSVKLYGDHAPGRIGNGRLEYAPPLADGGFRLGALVADNLVGRDEAGGKGPALQLKDAAQPGVLVIRMASSYVYLGGEVKADAVVGAGGRIAVEFSDNHGLDWREVGAATASGALAIDLRDAVSMRYDYRLRFTLTGAGTGLGSLAIGDDIQHSQRPLPALGLGDNTITFAGGEPIGTIAIDANLDPAAARKGGLVYAAFHPDVQGVGRKGDAPELALMADNGTGSITFPLQAPGAIGRLRVGMFYRCRGQTKPGAGWTIAALLDGGATWNEVGELGDTTGDQAWGTGASLAWEIPAKQRSRDLLVKISGVNRWGALLIHNLRIDADYLEPNAGLAPVKVTYTWNEDGQPRSDQHVCAKPGEQWSIHCAAAPVMESIVLERDR